MEEQIKQLRADVDGLNKLVGQVMQENVKLTTAHEELTKRLDKTDLCLGKVIGEFERHSHSPLGIAVIPVS